VQRDHPNFTYLPSITRPTDEKQPWHGLTGRIQDIWRSYPFHARWGFAPSPEHTHVLLCGNPAMIETMVGVLGDEGYREHTKKSPGQIHLTGVGTDLPRTVALSVRKEKRRSLGALARRSCDNHAWIGRSSAA
jgi:NAD(P)H-flavin reductase